MPIVELLTDRTDREWTGKERTDLTDGDTQPRPPGQNGDPDQAGQAVQALQADHAANGLASDVSADGDSADFDAPASARRHSEAWRHAGSARWIEEKFHKCLSPEATAEMESLADLFCCARGAVVFAEQEQPDRVLFLLEGRVRLSMNSIEGRRLSIRVAEPGDILGLASAVSGSPYEITAEARLPCRFASVPRQAFLDFLLRYPAASQNVSRQLSLEYKRACQHLRMLGLKLTASAKLARLLLEWCADGQRTERGVRIHCTLTHGEIGEYIGVARETVSRTLAHFKSHELVERRGSTLLVSSLRALEICAGQIDR